MISGAKNIKAKANGPFLEEINSLSLSVSPTAIFHSPPSNLGPQFLRRPSYSAAMGARDLKPFVTEDIKILLLENVNQTGQESLVKQGYQVESHKISLPEDELISKIR